MAQPPTPIRVPSQAGAFQENAFDSSSFQDAVAQGAFQGNAFEADAFQEVRELGAVGIASAGSFGAASAVRQLRQRTIDPYLDAVLADAPWAFYRLNAPGATADASGNGRTAASVPDSTAAVSAGSLTTAADNALRGKTAGLSIEASTDLIGQQVAAVECWVQFGSAPASSDFELDRGLGAESGHWTLVVSSGFEPYISYFDAGGAEQTALLGAAMTAAFLRTPHHFVMTYDGTTVTLYVDGAVWGSAVPTVTLTTARALFLTTNDTPQVVDEFAVYTAALSAASIAAHYAAGAVTRSHTIVPVAGIRELGQQAIASAESFGTQRLERLERQVAIGSSELVGTQRIERVARETGIATAELVGSQRLERTARETGIGTGENVRQPTAVRLLGQQAIATSESFGGNLLVSPKEIQQQAIGTAEQFGSHRIEGGAQTAAGTGAPRIWLAPRRPKAPPAEPEPLAPPKPIRLAPAATASSEAFGRPYLIRYARPLPRRLAATVIGTDSTIGSPSLTTFPPRLDQLPADLLLALELV